MGGLFFTASIASSAVRDGSVTSIWVRTLHAVIAQHSDGFQRPLARILNRDALFTLAPATDALKECAAHIPLRLARRQGGIKMDMRFDERRDNQLLLCVEIAVLATGVEVCKVMLLITAPSNSIV
jgi:hypothetical protein